ncbi:outer membrane protein assembly factor BamB family protein [Cellulomonas fengjieae]|uniref:outer membrane protein assembly factor BamB family protein n=1 Tax=Cellulomonas fengjieae TaxID=2819978 RepID=UPI001AAEBAE0|nr:PQQ-binding-like beta-propeller repeat protein [Cellulomonas fengjieae]MBO3103914.1 PQQ-binding-like beta-propeller repeat protein [Cellulomonas fengjieae]
MARGTRQMQEVDLVDGDEAAASDPSAGTSAVRARRRWVLVVAAGVVVVALVVVQQVVDARDRAAWARVADVDGVVRPLGDALEVRAVEERELAELDGSPRGPDAQIVAAPDGSQAVTSTPLTDDEAAWSVPLTGPDPVRAGLGNAVMGLSRCVPGAHPTTSVCLLSDGYLTYSTDDDEPQWVAATTTKALVVDTRHGTVVAEWPTVAADALTTLLGLVVVAATDASAGVTVVAYDERTGAERWRHVVPPSSGPDRVHGGTGTDLFAVGGLVVVGTQASLTLLDAEGRFVRDDLRGPDGYAYSQDGSVVVVSPGSGGEITTTFVGPDGDPASDRVYVGEPLHSPVDDGSVPGLLLTVTSGTRLADPSGESGPGLQAYDTGTGERRWFVGMTQLGGGMQPATAIVLDERVYVTRPDAAVVAIDAHTGATLWSAQESGSQVGIFTDGRLVYAQAQRPAGEGGAQLVGRDLSTGEEVWHAPLPDGIDNLWVAGHRLFGSNFTTGENLELG